MKLFEFLKTRWLLWVWNHTPDCADMSRLASRSLEQPLPLGTRLRMRLHYLICVWCQRYLKQLKFLHETVPHFDEHAGNLPDHGLSAEARQRIVQRLLAAENKSS
jgi:hypothetical protein